MTVKRFVWITLAGIVPFLLFHLLVWEFCTKQIFIQENGYIGDLGRMSYQTEMFHPKNKTVDLPYRHISYRYREPLPKSIDVLTIGDSFSNGAAGGKNSYYQDYLASKYKVNVLNISKKFGLNSLETLVVLLNSGVLAQWRPKVVILQIVERGAIALGKSVDFNQKESLEGVLQKIEPVTVYAPPVPSFINTLNWNALLYGVFYQFDDNAFFSEVYLADLDTPFFSNKPDKLMFYKVDIENIYKSTPGAVKQLNKNLNQLSAKLKELGISLYFMPAIDKYNLYARHIVDNPYPKSYFFDRLKTLEKTYQLIDTQELLTDLLNKKEIDVFYSDDTHWSYKASKYIVQQTRFRELEK